MMRADFEAARAYALERLTHDLPPDLWYHSLAHTRDEVVPAVEQLASLAGVADESLLLLRTAAWYHDVGFTIAREGHEALSVQIACRALPALGYQRDEIETISRIIHATRLPQAPCNDLEALMADADLDLLGRDDFWPRNRDLRAELAAYGTETSDDEWYRSQLAFLQNHDYFTAVARTLRDTGKQRNIDKALRLFVQFEALGPGRSVE